MTTEEAKRHIIACIEEHNQENVAFLKEERRERISLAQRLERIESGALAEDQALFTERREPQISGRRALGGLPIANIYPSVVQWESSERRQAWKSFLVSGSASDLQAALSVNVQPAGGFLVSAAISSQIGSIAFDMSPMRQICRTETLENGDAYEEPITVGLPGAEWVGETEGRNETADPDIAKVRADLNEIMGHVGVYQKLLDTSSYNVDRWLSAAIGQQFAISENASFVAGNGHNKPRGFLTHPMSTAGDASRPFGTLQFFVTGVNGAFANTNPTAVLDNVVASLKAAYRPNAVWLGNRATWGAVRALKDLDGNSLWQPSLQAGQPSRLLGYPTLEAEDMPDVATNSLSIAFGDFRQGYTIVDGTTMTLLRDPYTTKGKVKFYATRRVGGVVWNSECIKVVKFAAS